MKLRISSNVRRARLREDVAFERLHPRIPGGRERGGRFTRRLGSLLIDVPDANELRMRTGPPRGGGGRSSDPRGSPQKRAAQTRAVRGAAEKYRQAAKGRPKKRTPKPVTRAPGPKAPGAGKTITRRKKSIADVRALEPGDQVRVNLPEAPAVPATVIAHQSKKQGKKTRRRLHVFIPDQNEHRWVDEGNVTHVKKEQKAARQRNLGPAAAAARVEFSRTRDYDPYDPERQEASGMFGRMQQALGQDPAEARTRVAGEREIDPSWEPEEPERAYMPKPAPNVPFEKSLPGDPNISKWAHPKYMRPGDMVQGYFGGGLHNAIVMSTNPKARVLTAWLPYTTPPTALTVPFTQIAHVQQRPKSDRVGIVNRTKPRPVSERQRMLKAIRAEGKRTILINQDDQISWFRTPTYVANPQNTGLRAWPPAPGQDMSDEVYLAGGNEAWRVDTNADGELEEYEEALYEALADYCRDPERFEEMAARVKAHTRRDQDRQDRARGRAHAHLRRPPAARLRDRVGAWEKAATKVVTKHDLSYDEWEAPQFAMASAIYKNITGAPTSTKPRARAQTRASKKTRPERNKAGLDLHALSVTQLQLALESFGAADEDTSKAIHAVLAQKRVGHSKASRRKALDDLFDNYYEWPVPIYAAEFNKLSDEELQSSFKTKDLEDLRDTAEDIGHEALRQRLNILLGNKPTADVGAQRIGHLRSVGEGGT